jgi:hypothetical protein
VAVAAAAAARSHAPADTEAERDIDSARPASPLPTPAPPSVSTMNGSQIKQAAIQKAKQVANVSNGNANKKRKKELKPIITTDGPDKDAEAASNMASSNQPAAG